MPKSCEKQVQGLLYGEIAHESRYLTEVNAMQLNDFGGEHGF